MTNPAIIEAATKMIKIDIKYIEPFVFVNWPLPTPMHHFPNSLLQTYWPLIILTTSPWSYSCCPRFPTLIFHFSKTGLIFITMHGMARNHHFSPTSVRRQTWNVYGPNRVYWLRHDLSEGPCVRKFIVSELSIYLEELPAKHD